jgi:hypothetical protein
MAEKTEKATKEKTTTAKAAPATTAKAAAPKRKAKAKKATAPTDGAPTKPQKFKDFTILQKRSGRYEVLGKDGKNVNGDAKAQVLIEAKLVKVMKPKAKAEAAST